MGGAVQGDGRDVGGFAQVMNQTSLRLLLEEKIDQVKKQGHGEVIIKIRNGYVWRVLTTEDNLLLQEAQSGNGGD